MPPVHTSKNLRFNCRANSLDMHACSFYSCRRYDKGLVAIQSLAVFRLFGQRGRYESLRDVINTGAPFDIPTFDDCVPELPLCGVPMVNHTCGLILNLSSLDGAVVGVPGAMTPARFEAQEEITPAQARQQQEPLSSFPAGRQVGTDTKHQQSPSRPSRLLADPSGPG